VDAANSLNFRHHQVEQKVTEKKSLKMSISYQGIIVLIRGPAKQPYLWPQSPETETLRRMKKFPQSPETETLRRTKKLPQSPETETLRRTNCQTQFKIYLIFPFLFVGDLLTPSTRANFLCLPTRLVLPSPCSCSSQTRTVNDQLESLGLSWTRTIGR
jgi:hypothetical protein